MRRFSKNRWWAFILTLSVLLASSATLTSPSYGDGPEPIVLGDDGSGSGSSNGDPDGTSGPNKRLPMPGRSIRGGTFAMSSVGDGGTVWSVWSWRFHVVLMSLKLRYLR